MGLSKSKRDITRYTLAKRVELTTDLVSSSEENAKDAADDLELDDWDDNDEVLETRVVNSEPIATITIEWSDEAYSISQRTWERIVSEVCKEFNIVVTN